MIDIDLILNTEKTHIVMSEEGFDFLGFKLVRQYSKWRKKGVTKWFPSSRSELKIRESILAITNNNALLYTTPEGAGETLIPVLRGCGQLLLTHPAAEIFNEIWDYAQNRLMYMYCRQQNKQGT